MSIPIKINPLGVTPYVYIANPLVGKGTKADPVTLSFNPIYFSVDNDTSQLNINTANLALKSDLNSYVPISGGYMTGALTHNAAIYLNTTPATNHNFVVNTQVNKNESQLLFTINNNSQSQYTEWFFRDNTYIRYRHELNGGNGILTQFDLVSGENENDNTSYANFNCKVISQNEFISHAIQSYRIIYGEYGTFWRQDGTDIYLMITNTNDQYGTYNDLRPFRVTLSTGQVTLNNSLIITNDENKYVTISDNLGITNNSIFTNSSINVGQDLIANGRIVSKNGFLDQNDDLDITSAFNSEYRLVPFQVNDKNGKTFFYPELYLNGTNEIKSRIVLSNRAQNWYPYLEIGVTESNTPYISTNVSNTGNDTELARCDWVKNQINSIIGQDVITVYNGKTGILNNDGTDTSYAYISYKKSGNSGILYGNIQLSREACTNLKNNHANLRVGYQLTLSVPLYGYYSTDTTISTHFLTSTYPAFFFISTTANTYKFLDISTHSFMVGLSRTGQLLLACSRMGTTDIAADDLIFFDFIGLCHI